MSGLRLLILNSVATICVGCATANVADQVFTLDEETSEVVGWFSGTGEWILYPTQNFDRYDPYVDEPRKCVSLVNGTTRNRAEFLKLHGRRVLVSGFAIKYKSLRLGDSAADRLLSKRYHEDQMVENSCLRQWIIVATAIESD